MQGLGISEATSTIISVCNEPNSDLCARRGNVEVVISMHGLAVSNNVFNLNAI